MVKTTLFFQIPGPQRVGKKLSSKGTKWTLKNHHTCVTNKACTYILYAKKIKLLQAFWCATNPFII
jgi:hypothetical protein